MVNKVANGCHELVALPTTTIPPLVSAGIFRDAVQPQQELYQLNDYKMIGETLSSQLELIEQVTIQSSNQGMLMFCRVQQQHILTKAFLLHLTWCPETHLDCMGLDRLAESTAPDFASSI